MRVEGLNQSAFLQALQARNLGQPKTEPAASSAAEVTKSDSVSIEQKNTGGVGGFIAKIKGTNEAAGFVNSAKNGLNELLKQVDEGAGGTELANLAKSFSFDGKNVFDSHTFDTTAGNMTISVNLPDLSKFDKSSSESAGALKELLKSEIGYLDDARGKLSKPINSMGASNKGDVASNGQALTGGQFDAFAKISKLL